MMDTNFFTVQPMSYDFELEAGKTYAAEIKISSPAKATSDFHYYVSATPYSVVGENYDADLVSISNHSEIVDWIQFEGQKGVIRPNETATVKYKIVVPENAPAGGQYAAIAVRSDPDVVSEGGISVNNVFEIASIVYAEVAGETVHQGEITENLVPGFSTVPEIKTSATLTNGGNVHELAEFSITIKNKLSGEVVRDDGGVTDRFEDVIMPGTTRLTTRDVGELPALGIFEVTQDISYLGQDSSVTQTLVICPVWFMILVVATIIVAILTVLGIVKRNKKRLKIIQNA